MERFNTMLEQLVRFAVALGCSAVVFPANEDGRLVGAAEVFEMEVNDGDELDDNNDRREGAKSESSAEHGACTRNDAASRSRKKSVRESGRPITAEVSMSRATQRWMGFLRLFRGVANDNVVVVVVVE